MYVDANGQKLSEVPKEKIAGIIFKDEGKIVHRFSLSSANKPDFTYTNDPLIIKIDEELWYLSTLFSKDKNRIEGFDAYYKKKRLGPVRVIELADLDL